MEFSMMKVPSVRIEYDLLIGTEINLEKGETKKPEN